MQHGKVGEKRRKGYPSDVTDEAWSFVPPYLLLCRENSWQREQDLCEVFNAVRYVAKTGCPWRLVPGDLPPWAAVYQQMRRWLDAGCFDTLLADVQGSSRAARGSRRRCAWTAGPCSPRPSRARAPAATPPTKTRS